MTKRTSLPAVRRPWAALCLALVACGGGTSGDSLDRAQSQMAVPTALPEGFLVMHLNPFDPPAAAQAPAAEFWYRSEPETFTWYLRASGLQPNHAYRVEAAVDGRATFAIGSAPSDAAGALAMGGVLSVFTDRACVGDAADPPIGLTGAHDVRVALKNDGAPRAGRSGSTSLTSPSASLSCAGNGDGNFGYALMAPDAVHIGRTP